jgi:hypothetical protein
MSKKLKIKCIDKKIEQVDLLVKNFKDLTPPMSLVDENINHND